ncbi:MAG: cyclase family protein [Candidatus Bathyarchaeia archaeon]
MIDLSRYRIIDLTAELRPGRMRVDGRYLHRSDNMSPSRRLELTQWIYQPDRDFMHFVNTETHVGTHVEVSAHLNFDKTQPHGLELGRSASEYPLETWLGEACVIDYTHKKPVEGRGQGITAKDCEPVKERDIVLMRSPYKGEEQPYLTSEAQQYLVEKKIKQWGFQGVSWGNDPDGHEFFLKHDIPIIEGLVNLDQIMKPRVFYIGTVLRWLGLDSCWIRALVLEEL